MPRGDRGDAVSGAEGRLCAGVFVLVGMGLGASVVTAAGGGVSVDEQAATTTKIVAKHTGYRVLILITSLRAAIRSATTVQEPDHSLGCTLPHLHVTIALSHRSS